MASVQSGPRLVFYIRLVCELRPISSQARTKQAGGTTMPDDQSANRSPASAGETVPPAIITLSSPTGLAWDDQCDVLVVGQGVAGTSAALEAGGAGVDVI